MLVECVIGAKTLLLMVTGSLCLIYLMVVQISLNHQAYESLICLAENRAAFVCEREARQKLQPILFFGRLSRWRLYPGTRSVSVRAEWRMDLPWPAHNFRLVENQRLRLPIKERAE